MTDADPEDFEFLTRHDATPGRGIEGRARDLWSGAQAALAAGGPDRAGRVTDRIGRRGDMVVLVIAEYLSAAEGQGGDLGQLRGFRDTMAEARRIAGQVEALERSLRRLSRGVAFATTKVGGEDMRDGLTLAAAGWAEAARSMDLAMKGVEQATAAAPVDAKGAGGLVGRLRVSPDAALALKLGRIWRDAGLTLDGGRSGDGLDDVLAYVIEAVDPRRSARGDRKWLEKLLAELRKNLSSENSPRK